eukprot:gene13201-14552_t
MYHFNKTVPFTNEVIGYEDECSSNSDYMETIESFNTDKEDCSSLIHLNAYYEAFVEYATGINGYVSKPLALPWERIYKKGKDRLAEKINRWYDSNINIGEDNVDGNDDKDDDVSIDSDIDEQYEECC